MRGLRKLAGSLYKRLARPFTHRHAVYRRKGALWLLDRDSKMDEGLIKFKDYEDPLIEQARAHIHRHALTHLIDIGANLGYYTVRLGRLPQIREIHSFEPFPPLFLQIGANVLINGLTDKWHGHRCALSDHAGTATLHYHPAHLGTSSLDPGWTERARERIEVPRARLDDRLDLRERRCYVKIDVEGSELEVISGMQRFLRDNTVLVQIETVPERLEAVRAALAPAGLELRERLFDNDYLFAPPALSD